MSSDGAPPPAPAPWRLRIFGLTWLSYFSYYFTRQNYSVAKSSLDLGKEELRVIETAYLAAYAIGQFVMGSLADRVGPRRLLAVGMGATAVLSVVLGLSDLFAVFLIAYGLNGLAQASGWPANGGAMAAWFSSRERGEVMGYWGTCYQFGPLAATALASVLLATFGWRGAFFGPALWVGVVAVAVLLWLRDRPSDEGFRDPDVAPGAEATARDRAERRALYRQAWPKVVRNPMTWFMGANYFCIKLTRYSLMFWLPFYLSEELGFDRVTAGWMSTSFFIGGIAGVVGSGLLADRVFGRRRIGVAAGMTALLALALGLYGSVGADSVALNFAVMMLVGMLLYGPDALVSGAVAQDLGGPHAAALGCGMINGIGSVGAIAQGLVTTTVSAAYGWDALFVVFQLLAVVATLTLLPFFAVRPKR
jgi:sugar phosphate permease